MKPSVREQLEQMLKDLIARRDMLDKHVREYAKASSYNEAAINQTKMLTLTLVIDRVEEILK